MFLLAGCLFEDGELERIEREIGKIKREFFGTDAVILHSREIRKCEGAYQILFDLELKKLFYERLNSILKNAKFAIIGAGIQKKEFIEKYSRFAENPYSISMSFILERLIYCTNDSDAAVSIKIEKRGLKEDRQLIDHYNTVLDSGTAFVASAQLKERIDDLAFHAKRENIVGLQIADLCAYPLARHVLNAQEPYIPYAVIKNKIYCSRFGKINGYGLKIFP